MDILQHREFNIEYLPIVKTREGYKCVCVVWTKQPDIIGGFTLYYRTISLRQAKISLFQNIKDYVDRNYGDHNLREFSGHQFNGLCAKETGRIIKLV